MKKELLKIKKLLQYLDIAELRAIEDYAQYLRINLQDELFERFKKED